MIDFANRSRTLRSPDDQVRKEVTELLVLRCCVDDNLKPDQILESTTNYMKTQEFAYFFYARLRGGSEGVLLRSGDLRSKLATKPKAVRYANV